MQGERTDTIFISYAWKDDQAFVERLYADLAKIGYRPWMDKNDLPSRGRSLPREIQEQLQTCDRVLAILGPAAIASEPCQAERAYALDAGKVVTSILRLGDYDRLPPEIARDFVLDFRPSRPYEAALQELARLLAEAPSQAGDLFDVPALPAHVLHRPEMIRHLRDALTTAELTGRTATRVAAGIGLQGMAGVGKTVIATLLARDPVVRRQFRSGVHWITMGRKPRLRQEIRNAIRSLAPTLIANAGDMHSARRELARALDGKECLLVLDDLWDAWAAEPFLQAMNPRCRLLVTARDLDAIHSLGVEAYPLDVLTESESQTLLAQWSGLAVRAMPSERLDILRECGRLPLAVAIAGAMLRGRSRPYWKHVSQLLQRADLASLKMRLPHYPHTSVLRAIQVSFDLLKEEDAVAAHRFIALAVLPEALAIHPTIQQALWGADEESALDTAERLTRLSLAMRQADGSIRMHDLHLDYARGQYPDRQAQETIREAVGLSSHVISQDPTQFASQVAGRLLPFAVDPLIQRFTSRLAQFAPRPWIQSVRPALQPPGTPLIHILEGHRGPVRCVAMTPDGRRAVSGSDVSSAKAWDLESGGETHDLDLWPGELFCTAIAADGGRAIWAAVHDRPRLVDLETGGMTKILLRDAPRVFGVTIGTDGRYAILAAEDETLRVWELATGIELAPLRGHRAAVYCVSMSGDSQRAVSGSEDGTVRVWNLESRQELGTLVGHSAPVVGVAMTADGHLAVSASDDHTLRVWDLASGRALQVLDGYAGCFHGVAMSSDGRVAISAAPGARLKVWEVATGLTTHTLSSDRAILGVALSADGKLAISASAGRTLRVWDLTREAEPNPADHRGAVHRLSVSRSARRAVTASADSTLQVWDVDARQAVQLIAAHGGPVDGVAISPDGRHIVSAAERDDGVRFWDLERKRMLSRGNEPQTAVAVTPDGKRAICIGWGSLEMRMLPHGRKVRFAGKPPYSEVHGIAISLDGSKMLPACHGYRCVLTSLRGGKEIQQLRIHSGFSRQYYAATFTSLGTAVLLAGEAGELLLYDLESGRIVRWFIGHSGFDNVNDVALAPSGRRFASCSNDKTLKVWNLDSPSAIATFTGDAAVHCCAFLNEHEIMAGDGLGHVHFLRVNDREP